MNKYPKYLLPFFLIFCLIFLVSCFAPVVDSTKSTIQGKIMVPDSSTKDITGWVPLPNATVTITDSEGITHTVTTDSEGYYAFFDLPPGTNYIITATGQVGENTVILKDLIPLVEEGENYDAGTADCESTALPLVIEALLTEGLTLEEIDLEQIQNTDNFPSLVSAICLLLESYGDVTSEAAIASLVEEVVEEIIPPSPSPSPPAVSTDATLSDLVLSEGTLNPAFASATVSYTAQVENNITSITVTPNVGENSITIVVTAEDGTTTKTYTVIVTRAASSAKEIIYFYFGEDDDPAFDDYIDGDINSTLHTVSLTVPYETDVTDLTAYFELSDEANATVGGTPQESGDTVNDFTSPVIYTVTAEDSSTQNWMVTVYIDPPKTTTDIEEYEFRKVDNPSLSYDVEGIINYISHTVSLTVPYGIRNSLIAAFELAVGANATVGGTPQLSGVTANDFTLPVTYTVTAQDGTTTQDWIVTVDEEAVRYVATAANGGDNSNIGSEGSPWLTIQYALNTAPNLCTIIVKDNGPYNETINPPSDRVLILKSASGSTVINGESSACTVGMYGCPEGTTMEGFTITHDGVSGKGIYIQNGSRVSINKCTISNNTITSGACGIWISLGTNIVTLNNCTISNNTATFGGGILNDGANNSITLNNCTISGNQATAGNGGGINNWAGTLTINGGTISGNSASSSGGGIYQSSGTMTVQGCTISVNEAGNDYSAGICLDGGTNTIGGSGTDMNTICSNFITGNSAALDDQIGDGASSLYGTYSGTNNIEATCD
jgi:hypothetical protein